MRYSGATKALLAILLAAPLLIGVTGAQEQSSPQPPQDLKFVDDHWTAWDPPPAASGAYIIVKGDTLWDLAERWLGDPFLWPQIWDENRYILDSHWIYPGDPLVIPGQPTVVPDEGPPPSAEEPDEPDEPTEPAEEPPPAEPPPPPLFPVADSSDINCSGSIEPEHTPSGLWIAGRETEQFGMAEGHVVYLNQGRNQGIQPGDEFGIVREVRQVEHPSTGKGLGAFVRRLGKVRVMISHDNSSTAMIEMSCEDIYMNDELILWEEIPIPMLSSMPPFDRYNVAVTGGATGHIVHLGDDVTDAGSGHVIYTDLGVASGVRPGDVVAVYENRGELPRVKLGQAVILTVEPMTSTVKLINTVRETSVGHSVEVLR